MNQDHKNLRIYRNKIDELDLQIISLLKQRLDIAAEIGELKSGLGMPSLDPKRWDEIQKRLAEQAQKLEINPDMVCEIYEIIHKYVLEARK